mgnify:CR=1 FL=1
MASIRRRNNKWQAQVRRRHCPLITQTFRTKESATKWAREEETKIDDCFLKHIMYLGFSKHFSNISNLSSKSVNIFDW